MVAIILETVCYEENGSKHGFKESRPTCGVNIPRCFCGGDHPCYKFVELLCLEVARCRQEPPVA